MQPVKTEDERIDRAAAAYKDFLQAIGADLTDTNLKETPRRVAKMFICELLAGDDPEKEPEIKSFLSDGGFDPQHELVIVKDLPVRSTCAHHVMPIVGYAEIGAFYLKQGKKRISFPGLSKYGRVLNFYSRRFQLQERIGYQVAEHILAKTEARMVIVRINAVHHCMCSRGIGTEKSSTTTTAIQYKPEMEKIEGLNSIESIMSRFLREVGV